MCTVRSVYPWKDDIWKLESAECNDVVAVTTSFWQEGVSADSLDILGMGYWGMVYFSVEWCWATDFSIYKTVFEDAVIIGNVWRSEIELLMAGCSEQLVSNSAVAGMALVLWKPLNVRLNGGFLTKGGQTCKPAKFGRFRTVQEVLVSIVRVE